MVERGEDGLLEEELRGDGELSERFPRWIEEMRDGRRGLGLRSGWDLGSKGVGKCR